jgi:hypothetical protein
VIVNNQMVASEGLLSKMAYYIPLIMYWIIVDMGPLPRKKKTPWVTYYNLSTLNLVSKSFHSNLWQDEVVTQYTTQVNQYLQTQTHYCGKTFLEFLVMAHCMNYALEFTVNRTIAAGRCSFTTADVIDSTRQIKYQVKVDGELTEKYDLPPMVLVDMTAFNLNSFLESKRNRPNMQITAGDLGNTTWQVRP